jgi:hypothetical protein
MACLVAAHLAALVELDAVLAPTGDYGIYTHLGVAAYTTPAMMIEEFATTQKCIAMLLAASARGLTKQAHVGNLPCMAKQTCWLPS